jgi:hypothetical protein
LDWLAAHDEAIDELLQTHIPTKVKEMRDAMQAEVASMRDRFETEIKIKSAQHHELNEKYRELEVRSFSLMMMNQPNLQE